MVDPAVGEDAGDVARIGRVIYISNGNLPAPFAHTVQVARMAAGLAALVETTLVTGHVVWRRSDEALVRSWYDLPQTVRITSIGCRLRRAPRRRPSLPYIIVAVGLVRRSHPDLVFTRSSAIGVTCALAGIHTVIESSVGADSRAVRALARASMHSRVRAVVTVTEYLAQRYAEAGVPIEKLLVLPNASDPAQPSSCPKEDARRNLGLPIGRPLAVYAGNLYRDKGVHHFVSASHHCSDAEFIVVGDDRGRRDLDSLGHPKRVHFVGNMPHALVREFLQAADVLVLPNSLQGHEAAASATSPLKLFEYMQSGRPIVASRVPAVAAHLRHGVDGYLVDPDSPRAIADGISWVLMNPSEAARLASNAQRAVAGRTWAGRAGQILETLEAAAGGDGWGLPLTRLRSSRLLNRCGGFLDALGGGPD